MKLHFNELGEGQPFVILHGLFGYSDNWQSHAIKLAEYYRVITVDLRNHGHSEWSDVHTYEAMADDIHELFAALKLENVILMGHSMGGKTAMFFSQRFPKFLEKLIVVDMGIKAYPMHHQEILNGLNAIDLSVVNTRGEAEKIMSGIISSAGVRQFLLKNLYWKEKSKLAWRINISVLEAEMPAILRALPEGEVMTPTLFIKGAMSGYIQEEDWQSIEEKFPDSELVVIENAGHWVHAENPTDFLNAVLSFCLR